MTDSCLFSLENLASATLKGVGPRIAHHLKRLGITTLQDLLFHLPERYEDRTCCKAIGHLKPGSHAQIEGDIVHTAIKEGHRKSLLVKIQDDTGFLQLRFFNFKAQQFQVLSKLGQRLYCFGEVKWGGSSYEMIHPEYALLKENMLSSRENLTAIYRITAGISQFLFRKLIEQALDLLETHELTDYLPACLLAECNLPALTKALQYVHKPPKAADANLLNQGLHPMQQRLAFEELLAHQLSFVRLKYQTKPVAPSIMVKTEWVEKFINQLPFSLTQAQEKAIAEISLDMNTSPMLRLLQGDVGSGKTIVAAIAALLVVTSGYQVAIMAPTELLAEQHYQNFCNWFEKFGITITYLTGGVAGRVRTNFTESIAKGESQIVIGTHALFQKSVVFSKLGLIIVDEQHRFGVNQRLDLLSKGMVSAFHPHQLIMSATPIPRTLAMTAYADLDFSIINELPPGRMPIVTLSLANTKRLELIERVREKCKNAQAYWVCTLIEESEVLQCQAAEELYRELCCALPEFEIGLVHGRMNSKEKEAIMCRFKEKQITILVATTVIEVGVDVPNASLMIIENAERLGLAQLHQLRGRVGRGNTQSHCILVYQAPLSKLARERLSVMREHTDGFVIAQKDLELRGPGEVLGTRQTGLMEFRIANLLRDQHQLDLVQSATKKILQFFPDSVELIIKRWLAKNDRYTKV